MTCELCGGRAWFVRRGPRHVRRVAGRHRAAVVGVELVDAPPRAVGCWSCGGLSPTLDLPVPASFDASAVAEARAMGAREVVGLLEEAA